MISEVLEHKETYLEYFFGEHDTDEKNLSTETDRDVTNRGLFRALIYLRNYRKCFGEEKLENLLDSAMKGSENVLDFLDKDLAYRPLNMLGVALQPALMTSLATLVLGIILSYI
jgi:hypothetical protein